MTGNADGLTSMPIVSGPTPLERLAVASAQLGMDVWVKRDDQSATGYGGNKPRKLGYLLADARRVGADELITVGAYGSHHVLATAIHGRAAGFGVHAVVVPQPWTAHVEANVRLDASFGANLVPVSGVVAAAVAVMRLRRQLHAQGKKTYVIGPGGSSAIGSLGYVDAAEELAAQLARREMPAPSAVFVTLGSGGTVAGLAVGLVRGRIKTRLVGVRVVSPVMMNGLLLRRLVRGTAALLEPSTGAARALTREAMAMIEMDRDQLGAGYGVATDAGDRAKALAAQDGLSLENTYTAKTFAGLVRRKDEYAGKAVLYVHTFSSVDQSKALAAAPAAPAWLSVPPARANP